MWFSLNFSSRSLASLQRHPSRRLLAKTKIILCITWSWKTGRYNRSCPDLQQPESIPQDKTAQQADNSSHTSAAKVLDNSQQYTEWRIGHHGHDKLVELAARALKWEIQNPIHLLPRASNSTMKPPNMHGQYVVITVNVIKHCCAVR